MKTHAQTLAGELAAIVALADELHEVSSVNYDPHKVERMSRRMGIAILAAVPDSAWAPLDDGGRRRQRELIDRWNRWLDKVRLLFSADTVKVRRDLEKAADQVTKWLDRSKADWSVPQTVAEAGAVFRKHVQPLVELLAPFQIAGPRIVVPDTNVILRNQELASWAETIGVNSYTVLLVPGVLAELDEQKVNHRNPDVREKAKTFSNRIRGWRNQGSLTTGVRVQGEVTVRVVAREPDFKNTLAWLDPTVADDRIIASVLEWQRTNPMTAVQLLTADSIMLAKADEAGLPTGEIPD